jgi:hypothetical protein
MTTAIFGISNDGLNLVVNLFVLMLVVVWLALIVYTYLDAKRRIQDPFLVTCATIAAFIPYLGTAVYAILRPPEFLEDAHERELEIKAAELRVRQLEESSCPSCEFPVEASYLRCPQCQRRLKHPCPTCAKPVDPRWSLCPFCEMTLPAGERQRSKRPPEKRERARQSKPAAEKGGTRRKPPARRDATAEGAGETAAASGEAPSQTRQKRSTTREPDPDPRQA